MLHFCFFGTPHFSVIVLQELLNAGLKPDLVVTAADKPVGRKQILTPSPVKEFALKNNLPFITPQQFNNLAIEQLNNRTMAFGILAAYGQIIPKNVLNFFPHGILNIHPSLLPKYRGAAPLQTAILNGDSESGVTIIKMDEGVDTGAIIAQEKFPIEYNDTAQSLGEKLFFLGAKKLIEILPAYLDNKISPTPQNSPNSLISPTKKFSKQDGFIPFEDLQKATRGDKNLSLQIDRKARAFFPWPGIWTTDATNKRILIIKYHLEKEVLKIDLVKPEGKSEVKPSSL